MGFDFTSQINAWYEAIQFRSAPAAELAIYNAGMNSGMSAAAVQWSILSDAYTTAFVNPIIRLYQVAYNRVPDQAGLAYWAGRVASNPDALNDLAKAFAASDEFAARVGAGQPPLNSSALIAVLYNQAYGRNADPEGLAYWSVAGLTADRLLLAFSDTLDGQARTVAAVAALQMALVQGSQPTGSLLDLVSPPPADPTPPIPASGEPMDPPQTEPAPAANPTPVVVNLIDTTGTSNLLAGLALDQLAVINVAATAGTTLDASALSSVTDVNVTKANGPISIAAHAGSAVSVTNASGKVMVSGGSNQTVTTAGGVVLSGASGAVTVTDAAQGEVATLITGGTNVDLVTTTTGDGSITIGGTAPDAAPKGAVTIVQTLQGTGDLTGGAITVTGGTSISITVNAAQNSEGDSTKAGIITVTGTADTTSVAVAQTMPIAAITPVTGVAGVTEIHRFQFDPTYFVAGSGEAFEVAGLTFTVVDGASPEELAQAFSNLEDGATRGSSIHGNYAGSLTGWRTGPADGCWITLISTTPFADVPMPELPWQDAGDYDFQDGSPDVPSVAGVGGIGDGAVHITDASYGTGKANTIKSVVENGYASGYVKSDALTSLSLSNSSGQTVSIFNTKASTLALTVANLGSASRLDLDAAVATYTALTVTTAGADSTLAITGGAVANLKVTGTHALDLSGSTFAALQTVAVSGAAGLTLDASGPTVTDVNASGSTGVNVISLDGSRATYEGGKGEDRLILTSPLVSKAITLGAGNDTLVLHAGAAVSGSISGGGGTDTLVMTAADAATASQTTDFATKVKGFEVLSLTGGQADQTIDVEKLGFSTVTSDGEAVDGTMTLEGIASGGTLILTAASMGTVAVSNSAWGASANDSFHVVLNHAGALPGGTVMAADVEQLTIAANDITPGSPAGSALDSLRLVATDATTLEVTGNAHLSLDVTGSGSLVTLDASAMTGGLSVTTTGRVAMTVLGGAGANKLIAYAHVDDPSQDTSDVLIGGAGYDILVSNGGSTILTGGGGNDLFEVARPSHSLSSYTTITDASTNDRLLVVHQNVNVFWRAKTTLDGNAQLSDYVDASLHRLGSLDLGANILWFQLGGDTYMVEKLHEGTASSGFVPGVDMLVKLTGLLDLSKASFDPSTATFTFA